MNRLKQWLAVRFLPAYAREGLLETIAKLERQVEQQAATIREQRAYMEGMEAVMRAQRKITINSGGGR